MYCNQCGKPNSDNARFCSHCGESLNHIASMSPATSAPAQAHEIPPTVSPDKVTSHQPTVHPPVSSWMKSIFLTFAAWTVCAVLLFCNWFNVDLYFAEVKFSVFSLNKATSSLIGNDVYDLGDSLEILNIFIIISSVLFLLSLAITVFLFIKKKKGMYATGLTLSLLLITFTVIVMIAYFSATGGDDLSGLIVDSALKMTAAPYILLIFAVISIITLLISLSEFRKTAPRKEKVEKQAPSFFEKAKQKIPEFTSKLQQCFSNFLKNVKPVFQKIVSSKIFIPIVIIAIVLIVVIIVVSGLSCAPQNDADNNAYYLESDSEYINIEDKTLQEIIPIVDKFVEFQSAPDDTWSVLANLYNEDILNFLSYTKYPHSYSYYESWSAFLREEYVYGDSRDYATGIDPYAWSIFSADYTYSPDLFIDCKYHDIDITNAVSLTLVYSFENDGERETNRHYDHNGREFWNSNSFVSIIELVKIDSEWYLASDLPVSSQELDDSTLEHYENLFWDCVYSDLSEENTSFDDSSQEYDAYYEEDDHEYTSVDEDTYFNGIEFIDAYDSSWDVDYDLYMEIVPIVEQYVIALKNNDISGIARLYSDEMLQYYIADDPDEFKYDNWEDILRTQHDSCWFVNYENLDYLDSDITEWTISYAYATLYNDEDIDYMWNETGVDLRGAAAIYVNLNISDIDYEDALYLELFKIGSEWYIAE